jgi:hypothetical protein
MFTLGLHWLGPNQLGWWPNRGAGELSSTERGGGTDQILATGDD